MLSAVSKALADLRDSKLAKVSMTKSDHGQFFRSACLFVVKVCQDEADCYRYFFTKNCRELSDYMYAVCQNLYDMLRPCLISINHIEVLSELCTILKEQISNCGGEVEPFVDIVNQLLQDVEERLVFRTNIFFQYDIAGYAPCSGDLAYPEKLIQMEFVADELSSSRNSSLSLDSQEVARINAANSQFRSFTGNSPADLHGMWYPTVKRTLVCLSRLYICLDRDTFQGVSQEGLLLCVKTIDQAAQLISKRRTALDGRLFQIKHLLIIREQIAPFQVDFTIKELGLDFSLSHVKSAALELVHNADRIFTMSGNNAILEFLLEGSPRVKEYLIDSRKEIDRELKSSCEEFISHITGLLVGELQQFLGKGETQTAQVIAAIVATTKRNIKIKLPEIQRSMRLYLANRETEFILFRPVRNNVVDCFSQLEQFLSAAAAGDKLTSDDLLLIGCPSVEQVNVLISSVALTAEREHYQHQLSQHQQKS